MFRLAVLHFLSANHRFRLICALVTLLFIFPFHSAADARLIYTPLPLTNSDSVIAQSRDLIRYIEQNTGFTIEIRYEADYATIIDKFARDEIHLVHLGPLPYIVLRAVTPYADPLVFFQEADGRAGYTCSLASAIDGDTAPADTEGPVALTQSLSTCGFLVTQHLLGSADRNLHVLPYSFLGSHEAVALALVRGEFAIGGLKTSIGREYERVGLRLLMEGPELPGFALVANTRLLDQETRDALSAALVATPASVYSQWQGLGRWGMAKAMDSSFDGLRCLEGIDKMPDCGEFNCAVLQSVGDGICNAE